MHGVFQRKLTSIQSNLKNGNYNNPFKPVRNYKINDEKFIMNNNKQQFNGCNTFGFYNDFPCDVVDEDTVITPSHIDHLKTVKKKWKMDPSLLIMKNGVVKSSHKLSNLDSPDDNWVSASNTRNYMLDDPLIDHLKHNNITTMEDVERYNNGINTTTINNSNTVDPLILLDDQNRPIKRRKRSYSETFTEQLFTNGNDFESDVIEMIKELTPIDQFIQIGESFQARNYEKYIETIKSVKMGYNVIYQPVLWNAKNKTYGCGDLLIRSDFKHKLFAETRETKLMKSTSRTDMFDDETNYVYNVYEIKWSTIKMSSNSDAMLNDGSSKAYKSQLWIYNEALNYIQDRRTNEAYVIGKGYTRSKTTRGVTEKTDYSEPLDTVACVYFNKESEVINKSKKAIMWNKKVKTSKKLTIDPPNHKNLYPNMKNSSDNEFKNVKSQLAKKNKEITLLYSVGKKSRDLALEQGVDRYDNPELDIGMLGMIGAKRGDNIENILKVNHENSSRNIIIPKLNNENNWKNAKLKCYLDIETINSSVYNLEHDKTNYIFMIGIGVSYEGSWLFKVFTVTKLETDEETRIISEFNDFMEEIHTNFGSSNDGGNIPMFHWSNFEKTNLEPFVTISPDFKFVDMCKWFTDSNIAVKGALDYKLKSVAKSMKNHNFIDISWPEEISNGLNAMNMAYNYYTSDIGHHSLILTIEDYNEVDCKSMYEIHNYLKSTGK